MVSKTWYDQEKNRWEMDPVAVPYAVSKKLVEHVQIRHDWAVMYIVLKGDDKQYYVDIKVLFACSLFHSHFELVDVVSNVVILIPGV